MKIFQIPVTIFSSIEAIIVMRTSYLYKVTFVEKMNLSLFRTEAKKNLRYKTVPCVFSTVETETWHYLDVKLNSILR